MVHFSRRDPALERKYFCSRICFYTYYIAHGPKTAVDYLVIWPVFEAEHLSTEERVNLMCCYDEYGHFMAFNYGMPALPKFLPILLAKYKVTHLKHCLIVLMSIILNRNRLLRITKTKLPI